MINSRFRRFLDPIVHYVQRLEHDHPDRRIAVIVTELVHSNWWHWLLHNRRAAWLKAALLQRCGSNVVVIAMPFHLQDSAPSKNEDDNAKPPR
jgi:hypothetical protein